MFSGWASELLLDAPVSYWCSGYKAIPDCAFALPAQGHQGPRACRRCPSRLCLSISPLHVLNPSLLCHLHLAKPHLALNSALPTLGVCASVPQSLMLLSPGAVPSPLSQSLPVAVDALAGSPQSWPLAWVLLSSPSKQCPCSPASANPILSAGLVTPAS